MPEYFSLDRRGLYRVGEALVLHKNDPQPLDPITLDGVDIDADLLHHLSVLFPDGLSPHGWDYMKHPKEEVIQNKKWFVSAELGVEMACEYVRQVKFPHLTSRLQSYYAFSSLAEVEAFRARQPGHIQSCSIYRLESNIVRRADQYWLKFPRVLSLSTLFAHNFWSEVASPNPEWEFLLTTPVEVVEQVA